MGRTRNRQIGRQGYAISGRPRAAAHLETSAILHMELQNCINMVGVLWRKVETLLLQYLQNRSNRAVGLQR
ncbi:unnamed protein product, partial [Vitis vinifera]